MAAAMSLLPARILEHHASAPQSRRSTASGTTAVVVEVSAVAAHEHPPIGFRDGLEADPGPLGLLVVRQLDTLRLRTSAGETDEPTGAAVRPNGWAEIRGARTQSSPRGSNVSAWAESSKR